MPFPNEHACRVREPGEFTDGSFRRISQEMDDGRTIDLIIGRLKGEDMTTVQAYRYPKDGWQEDEARDHCDEHEGRFEAATGDRTSHPVGDAPEPENDGCPDGWHYMEPDDDHPEGWCMKGDEHPAGEDEIVSRANPKMEYRAAAEIRLVEQGDDAAPKIVGYAAVFDSLSRDLGGFREKIMPGAFTRSIKRGDDVAALFGHNPELVLGRLSNGTLRMEEDDHGLRVEIDPPDTTTGRDVVEYIRRGDIDAMSFGFVVDNESWSNDDDGDVRTLHAVSIYDVSAVTFPAYPDTTLAVRSRERFIEKAMDSLDSLPGPQGTDAPCRCGDDGRDHHLRARLRMLELDS